MKELSQIKWRGFPPCLGAGLQLVDERACRAQAMQQDIFDCATHLEYTIVLPVPCVREEQKEIEQIHTQAREGEQEYKSYVKRAKTLVSNKWKSTVWRTGRRT